MEKEMNHKQEIIETRTKGLGSSDAKMILQVAIYEGELNTTAKDRIAIMLGLKEKEPIHSKAIAYGNYIENEIHGFIINNYKGQNIIEDIKGNPYNELEDDKKRFNFKVFNHIDHEIITEDKIIWFETKTVNDNLEDTIKAYDPQLQFHFMIGENKAKKMHKAFELYIIHYQTENKDDTFDQSKIVIHPIEKNEYTIKQLFVGLEYINDILPTFKYEEKEVIQLNVLPDELQKELDEIIRIQQYINESKEKEKVFKEKIYKQMEKNNLKKIETEKINITYVAPQEPKTKSVFDMTKFESENPEIVDKYQKEVTDNGRKGYVLLKIKGE